MRAFLPQLLPLLFALGAIVLCFLVILAQSNGAGGRSSGLRPGLLGDITEKIARALLEYVGAQFVGGVRTSLDFPNVVTQTQQQLTLTVTGALLGDFVQVATETALEAGLQMTAVVTAADTVTVTVSNNTAADINPAANVYRGRVTREAKR